MRNQIIKIAFLFCLFSTLMPAQNKSSLEIADTIKNKSNAKESVNGVTATGDVINVKDDAGNVLMTVTDEGSAGSIKLNDAGAVSPGTNKLYNNGGSLYWNGSALSGGSGATELNDLTDAKYDGSSLFVGSGAGANDDGTSNLNTAVGKNALNSNTTGSSNTANGYQSLNSNTTGNYNTATGSSSLNSNTTGNSNTANGLQSLYLNTTGSNNTAAGYRSLRSNTTGSYNTANGLQSLNSNTTGNYNIATGSYSLYNNTTGNSNTATGYASLYSNTSGDRNTSVGYQALYSNTIGTNNVGIGTGANYSNQEGSNNTMVGYQAGRGSVVHNKSGNIFIGYQAGYHENGDNKLYINNDSSSTPLIYGDFAQDILTINGSFASGYNSKAAGSNSVALGTNCIASGSGSIAFGIGSIAGNAAVAIGIDAIALEEAEAFGTEVKASAIRSMALGNFVETTGTGSLIIGDNSVSTILTSSNTNTFTARFSGGYKFFTNSSAPFVGAKLDSGANSWAVISDSTKKENFKLVDSEDVLNKISQFKLTSWNYKGQNPTKFRHYGPMAQDFFSAFGNDGIGTVGNDTTISSADFTGINFIAVQALEKRTKQQKVRITTLEAKIQNLEEENKRLISTIKEVDDIKAVLNVLLKQQPKINKFSQAN